MVKTQFRTIAISDVSETILDEIYRKDEEIRSCLCSTASIAYEKFVSHHITYHPVCRSYFITQQWITALYTPNASRYIPRDFRMIAHSQFQLLADFCSLTEDMVSQAKVEIANYKLITVSLLSKEKLEFEVNATIKSVRNSTSIRLMSYVDYINTTTQSNNFISALNTNTKIETKLDVMNRYVGSKQLQTGVCGRTDNIFMEAVFYATQSSPNFTSLPSYNLPNYEPIIGFSAACTPFEGFLRSTLDCLHDKECIQLLMKYFPSITRFFPEQIPFYTHCPVATPVPFYTHCPTATPVPFYTHCPAAVLAPRVASYQRDRKIPINHHLGEISPTPPSNPPMTILTPCQPSAGPKKALWKVW
ncbi:hypothetical protein I4U23_027295 [Adineta vaga]|nr:hypothetical protein I4U23_027295 [Adineta vaga]